MTVRRLQNRIEIRFWHLAVILLSESRFIREAIRWGYPQFQRLQMALDPNKALKVGLLGISAGFVLGLVISVVFV